MDQSRFLEGAELLRPSDDAEPEKLLRAAEALGPRLRDRAATPARPDVPLWPTIAAPSGSTSSDERRAAIERQLVWARAGGASWDGIEFVVDAAGNASVRATRELAAGDPILTLPRRLMIIDNELAASTTGDLGLEHPRDALAAWLPLEAREPASRWRAYLDVLPRQLPELPMFRTAEELAALAGTTARALAASTNHDVIDTYGRLSPALRARISLADFAWGRAIVMSRAYHAPGTLEHRVALFPVVDILDHRLGDTTWTYDPLDQTFVISTERAFAAGDAVHLSYGARSNTHLLVHFGFTLAGNPADEAGLLFECPTDPVNDVAAHLLWKLPLATPIRIRVACIYDHRFLRVLSLARLHASGPSDRARALESGLSFGEIPWLGSALEESAFGVLATAARRAVAELDAQPSRAWEPSWDGACANVRDGERRVLDQILELASTAPAYLHRDRAHVRAAAEAIPSDAIGARSLLRSYLRALAEEL